MERNTATTKGKEIIRTAAPNEVLRERMHIQLVEWSGVEYSTLEWSGVERSGVEWSGV